jgi:predicted RNase H-like HicB family nuclease
MHYPILIRKSRRTFGVTVPDLPGCTSAGGSIEDAIGQVREAMELHLQGLIEGGDVPPDPTPIDTLQADPEHAGGICWALVRIEPAALSSRPKKVLISLPETLLVAMDAYAEREGETRSGLIARAAWAYLGGSPETTPTSRPARTPAKPKRKAAAKGKKPVRLAK